MDRDMRDGTPEGEWLQQQEGEARRRRAQLVPEDDPARPRRRQRTLLPALGLVLLLTACAFEAWTWVDARTPPDGAQVHSVTVDDRVGTGTASGRTDDVVLTFTTPDGEAGEVLYEDRLFDDVEEGDTIEVYRDRGEWRTTVEQSPAGALRWLGGALFLVLLGGVWVRMRRHGV